MSTISIRDGQIFLTNANEVTDLTSAIAALVIDSLSDVAISSVQNGEVLVYNSTSGDWENSAVDTAIGEIDGGTY